LSTRSTYTANNVQIFIQVYSYIQLQEILLIVFHHTVPERASKSPEEFMALAGMITLPMFGNFK
jgi:hypothetical protein